MRSLEAARRARILLAVSVVLGAGAADAADRPVEILGGRKISVAVPKDWTFTESREPKTGACESVLSIPNEPSLEHRLAVIGGVKAEKCAALLQEFFRKKREG